MLKLSVVDHVMKDPRAAHLASEVIERLPAEIAVTLVSSGEALERMAELGNRLVRPVALTEEMILGHRFAVAYKNEAQYMGQTTAEMVPDGFLAADLVWFPSAHHHLWDVRVGAKVVASFHDAAPIEMAEFLAAKGDAAESAASTGMAALADLATRRMMRSSRVVTSSQICADWLTDHCRVARPPSVVPLPTPSLLGLEALPPSGLPARYLVCVAPIDPLSNHETLLMAKARGGLPLVLAGEGTEKLATGGGHRADYLKGLIEHLGLVAGQDLIGLGPLAPLVLNGLLQGACGVVAPILAEGPALASAAQAAELGLPLALSDLPALRAYAARRGFTPLWVKPGSSDEIAAALSRLPDRPRRPPAALPDTDWDEVARSYLTIFVEQLERLR